MAREILVGEDGKAQGVSYIDKATRTEQQVSCARRGGGGERLRIGATAAEFALAARFRTVWRIRPAPWGATLMDSVGSGGGGYFPQLEKVPPTITMASAGCTCTCRGGSSTVRTIFSRLPHRIRRGRHARRRSCLTIVCRSDRRLRSRISSESAATTTVRPSGSPGRGEMIPNRNAIAISIRMSSMSGAYRCCVSISNGATTKCGKRKICRKRFGSIVETAGGST